jgi:hypothetical protein
MRVSPFPALPTLAVALVCGCSGGSADAYKTVDTPFIGIAIDEQKVFLYEDLDGLTREQIVSEVIVAELLGTTNDDRQLYYGVAEVSREQWQEVMGTRPWTELRLGNFTSGVESTVSGYPAYGISYDEALAFVDQLSRATGLEVSLADPRWLDPSGLDLSGGMAVREETDWFEPVFLWEPEAGETSEQTSEETSEQTSEEGSSSAVPSQVRVQYGTHIRHLYGNVREWYADGLLSGGGFGDNRAVVIGRPSTAFPSEERNLMAGLRIMIRL